MKRRDVARLAGLAGLLLPLPLLAACGAEPTTTASAPVAVEARGDAAPAVATREADGAAFVAKLRTALEQLTTTRFEVGLTGSFEASATGAADLTTKPPTVQVVPDTALFGLGEVRLVDGVAYAELDGQWVKADLSALSGMLPMDLGDLDLDQLADTLAAGLSDVDVSGDTGEQVWRATVDPSQLLDGVLGDSGLGGLGNDTAEVPTDVDLTATFTGDRLDALVVDLGDLGTVELTLSDQGEPVDITAPRGDVTDFSDFGWFASTPGSVGG